MNDFESTMTDFRQAVREQGPSETETSQAWMQLLARVDDGGSVNVSVVPGDVDPRPFEQRRWLAVAAALLVVVGVAATFVSVTRDHVVGPVAQPTEPLFLLPQGSGYVVSDGVVDADLLGLVSAGAEQRRVHTTLLGTPDGNGFGSLVGVVTFLGSLPEQSDNASLFDVRNVTTASGPAVVWSLASIDGAVVQRWAFQQREGYWIQVQPGFDVDDDTMIAVLEAADVVDGRAHFDTTPHGLVEIMSADTDDAAAAPAVTFQVLGNGLVDDSDNGPAEVDTLAWPLAAIMSSPNLATHLEPFDVNGTAGWLGTLQYGANVIVWQTTSGHVVGVSGQQTVQALAALANSLERVDEQTWRTATRATDRAAATDPAPTVAP